MRNPPNRSSELWEFTLTLETVEIAVNFPCSLEFIWKKGNNSQKKQERIEQHNFKEEQESLPFICEFHCVPCGSIAWKSLRKSGKTKVISKNKAFLDSNSRLVRLSESLVLRAKMKREAFPNDQRALGPKLSEVLVVLITSKGKKKAGQVFLDLKDASSPGSFSTFLILKNGFICGSRHPETKKNRGLP